MDTQQILHVKVSLSHKEYYSLWKQLYFQETKINKNQIIL